MQLTQKETELLKELKEQENLCIERYTKHSSCAVDAQLKGLFTKLADDERQHYDTITSIENGSVPGTGGGGQGASQSFSQTYSVAPNSDKKNDCYLCEDLLSAEKHASHLYDTCVFEFSDEGVRNALNHIQKDEQNHGKLIYDYMTQNNMYS